MRKVVSAYEDSSRRVKICDMPCSAVPDGFTLPDDLLKDHARSAMLRLGNLTPDQAATAYFVVEEGS